jgi:hypothetical protein
MEQSSTGTSPTTYPGLRMVDIEPYLVRSDDDDFP